MKKWELFKIVWFSLVGLFFLWNWISFQSRNLPTDTWTSNEVVSFLETADALIFKPTKSEHTVEFLFFPGGLADTKAYAPLGRKIAENGFTCHIIKMRFRLAQYDYQKILTMFDLKSGQYVIGGHSQGGKMAAQFVYENKGLMKGLFIMGTSHPRDIDLSSQSIPTLKLYAENDGLASVPEVLENKNKLPSEAKLILLEGGNHSQFGYLGTLLGDDIAKISLEEQQSIVLKNIISLLNDVEKSL